MGVMKFRLNPPDLATRHSELRKAFMTGLDRTPGRSAIDLRPGLLICHRDTPESGRLNVPWPIVGFGQPMIATATLGERQTAYDLAVELARGKLNDVLNQASDWRQMGLDVAGAAEPFIHRARRGLARAATSRDLPEECASQAALSLEASCQASRALVEAYTNQLLRKRLQQSSPLPTLLACGVDGVSKLGLAPKFRDLFHAGRVRMAWNAIVPDEGKKRWDETDAQIQWCRKNGLTVTAGPLIEFRAGALPDSLWLWEGDYEEIQSAAVEFVRSVMTRYRGKVAAWHLVHRVASGEVLGLSEEEQIRLTAQLIQVARRVDPDAHLVIDLDRPWSEWMATSSYQLGPLHLADSLARAELGLGGIGLEIAPGFAGVGSHLREILDFSRLLDLFALVNLPIHLTFALPSSADPDPRAGDAARVDVSQWPGPPDEASQLRWASSWVALAAAKPFVRSITWAHACDASPHLFPHSGLIRADGSTKPLYPWFEGFRERLSHSPRP